MIHQQQFHVETSGHRDMHDITDRVAQIVAESGMKTGTVQVFNVGSTAAVGTIEFEPGLERDLPETLDRLIPPSRDYGHERAWHDGNGHSHVRASLLGPSLSVPFVEGRLTLGTWQQIILVDFDTRTRTRTVVCQIIGE